MHLFTLILNIVYTLRTSFMHVLVFDFATKNLHLATIFYHLSLVFTSDASISASTRIKIFPFSCACAYACVRLCCVKTEHYACAYACVASENQA